MNFETITNHIIPLENFDLKWRFTEEKYTKLPLNHLEQLYPLDGKTSKFLSDYIAHMHHDTPFKKDFFRTIDKAKISDENRNEKEIKKWLYQRGIPFAKSVFLSWDDYNAMIVPWKILIKYYDSFYYPSSDDLTVFDLSLDWALVFYHEEEIYFGTNKRFEASKTFEDIDFIW